MRRLAALSLAVLVLLLGACGDDGPGTLAIEGPRPEVPGGCDPDAVDASELERAVDVAVPDGFERQPDDVADTGPSDLEKAARDESGPDGRARLQSARFLRGYQRLWVGPDYTELIGFVYEFCDPAGAQAFAPGGGIYDDPDTRVEVADLDGARGFAVEEGLYSTAQVEVVRGRYVILAVVAGEADTAPRDVATGWATDLARAMVERVDVA